MNETAAIILAAGQGTRMCSDLIKVLHPLAGIEIIKHVVRNVQAASFDRVVVVVGYQGEKVQAVLGDLKCVEQKQLLGTGHAVDQCRHFLANFNGPVLVTYGDTPLFRGTTFSRLMNFHRRAGADATILTALLDDPTGYGRVLRTEGGDVRGVVEQKDASPEELLINEINTGTYCFDSQLLFDYLSQITPDNIQAEYYLPDVLPLFIQEGHNVAGYVLEDAQESMGINDRRQLAKAESILQKRITEYWMEKGVTFIDPEAVWIEGDCLIGPDTIIYPQCLLQKGTVVGNKCLIGPNCRLSAARVGDGATIESAVIIGETVAEGARIVPFTYLTK